MCERDELSGVWLRGSTWRGRERARTCPRSQRARWERVYILKSRCLLEYTGSQPSLSHGLTRTVHIPVSAPLRCMSCGEWCQR